ncbi:ankyrin repeat and MYND domain-containing protein 1 [Cheilinus undulatus]|uniref:ankyrin repeat and MYND domain-containing protein 1 n=1 Tax=Cheilinus undulatus TaxID=241271 RepID=UPI001BD58BFD|nr:ankyrin repeat and MYND domain-containing protein 1 [Cheilinus undulatus]
MRSTCKGVSFAGSGRRGEVPRSARKRNGHKEAEYEEGEREGPGVQEWHDGSRYEGEFVNGLKHGKGRYTCGNGEYYEGLFYKDFRHGDAVYCWPSGHKFIGKFYLNRREGFGKQLFPDGSTFQGLYHADQRFGPGVLSDPDGTEDVGLWLGNQLLKICSSVKQGFSLKCFPEYATYMDQANSLNSLIQAPFGYPQTEPMANCEVDSDTDLQLDDDFILPPGIEHYSTDADHLPLPPGRRRELDKLFYGDMWEPDPYKGYKRFPLSDVPLQPRMQAIIHKHWKLAKNVDWDVAAVLSLNREGFGPKGHLEVSSEKWIQHASKGNREAMVQMLLTRLIHPDVSDSQGHTALIAATINCQNKVIPLLLDLGVDIDKLNHEGMSALAVCHVLYYSQSLCTTSTKLTTKTQTCESSPQISQVDFTANLLKFSSRPQIPGTTLNEINQSPLPEHDDKEVIPEQNKPATLADTEHLQNKQTCEKEEEEEGGRECKKTIGGGVRDAEGQNEKDNERESKWEEREKETGCDQTEANESKVGEREVEFEEKNTDDSNSELVERKEPDDLQENLERRGEIIHEESGSERSESVQSNKQKQCEVETEEGVQHNKNELIHTPTTDDTCSVSRYNIHVREDVIQHSTGILNPPQCYETESTIQEMSGMKMRNNHLTTLKLLLDRGADPNASRVPMPVLFLAIMAEDTEAVRRLLLCGARTDVPLPDENKGLYPLHVAAALTGPVGPEITELLLHAVADPDAQACDQDEIYEPDKADNPLSTNENHVKAGGRTALHMACQKEGDYMNASKVVALLLAHGARTDLIWSGHSPLSLAIASGNDLAVEELLKGGADPNLPLGRKVGSALCALANFSYHLRGNRDKLLGMLVKAGVDILMPVKVGEVVGYAVDYAHHSFNQDLRIARTPFHVLSIQERETLKARRLLLSMMGDLMRQTACQKKSEQAQLKLNRARVVSSKEPPPSSEGPEFKFCYQCGRSVFVKLTACSRCHKVLYCSRNCKLEAWDERHKQECTRVSASADATQKIVVFKSQGGPRPLTATLKLKTVPKPLMMELKSQRLSKPLSKAAVHDTLKENYSFN